MSVVKIIPAGIKPLGYEQITVGQTVGGLTVPPNTTRAIFGVEGQPLRYRTDGEDVTADAGFLVKADVSFEIVGKQALTQFKAIRSGGTDATINVLYYGE